MDNSRNEPKLRFCDDPMFKRVMEREDICRGVIERVVGKPIGEVVYQNTEQEHRLGPYGKTICMDSYLVEYGGRVYDVEMQMSHNPLLPMRFRGYQAVMDGSLLRRGEDYDRLFESYIVFICMKDPFGEGLPVYSIERTCLELPGADVGCKAHWVALNASAWEELGGGSELGSLLRYVYTEEVPEDDGLVQSIAAEVAHNNDDREWAAMLFDSITTAEMEARVRGRYEGRKEGHEQGLEEGREEGRKEGLRDGREEGLRDGREEGEARYAKLVENLLAQNRIDDIKLAGTDSEERRRLFREFGL